MIRVPPGFSLAMDGDVVVLQHPSGDGLVRYIERLRPVPAIEELWGDELASSGPPRRFVTDEGEYAWILDGERAGDDYLGRVVGAVVGDDFLAVVEALAATPSMHHEQRGLVEDLLRADDHVLGARRRPYWHHAPAGWTVEPRAPFYLTYRSASACLSVSPAIPVRLVDRGEVFASLGLPDERASLPVSAPFRGERWSAITDDDHCVEAFLLDDGEYLYPAVGTCAIGDLTTLASALDGVLSSVEPIPRPRGRGVSIGAFSRAINAGFEVR